MAKTKKLPAFMVTTRQQPGAKLSPTANKLKQAVETATRAASKKK